MTADRADLTTVDPGTLDREEIFRHLPANRVGAADRRYLDEVLADGFGPGRRRGHPRRPPTPPYVR
ncbi:MAG: hypothetical protein OXJ90_11595, partial [Spirochaetaceae bacterium]|nr:hypothetical protein [Spirochaetaceae bacterium]